MCVYLSLQYEKKFPDFRYNTFSCRSGYHYYIINHLVLTIFLSFGLKSELPYVQWFEVFCIGMVIFVRARS